MIGIYKITNNVTKKSFERMVTGRSYNHIPKYIKRKNKWEN